MSLGFFGGFAVTLKQVGEPRVTTPYPAEKVAKPPRLHGRHVLNRYEDGMEKCIGCELCAAVCPADCIYVRGARQSARRTGLPRRALRLRLRDQLPALHPLRPVRRGLPDRSHHRDENVRVLLYEPVRRHLHQSRAGGRRRRPPNSSRGRIGGRARTDHTSAWMRATSPSGAVGYEGEVQWSGELGYGVRPPEAGQSGDRDDEATGNISDPDGRTGQDLAAFGGTVRGT